MASPEEMAATMLKNLPDKTGKTLQQWHAILKKSSLEKHGQLVKLLKKEYRAISLVNGWRCDGGLAALQ